VDQWVAVPGLYSHDSDGFVDQQDGNPRCKNSNGAIFYSPDTDKPTLGTSPGQYNFLKLKYGGGRVQIGVRGGVDGFGDADVGLFDGVAFLHSAISHDGKNHYDLKHNIDTFKAKPGQIVYLRVHRKGTGQFAVEMKVESGPWGHLTPNGEALLPKAKRRKPLDGLRVVVTLASDKALIGDLRVGREAAGERWCA
jgi:hypothetical protein